MRPSSVLAAMAKDRAEHDPFGSRVPDHSVVHRYARCLTYPEWGVGTVAGIYFSTRVGGPESEDEEVQQWARVKFSHGVRTVPAGSMKFVDFSTPDPASERVERFLLAAQRAMADGEYVLAAQRLIYARDAEPRNVAVLRLMTLAFWNAGRLEAGGAGGARLGARGRPPAGGPPLRGPHLRGHGRDRPRRGGRRAGRRSRAFRCGGVGATGQSAIAVARSRGLTAGAAARIRAWRRRGEAARLCAN